MGLYEDKSDDWLKDETLVLNSLKELTRKVRPCCDIDGLPVGAIWYQLKKTSQDKILTKEMNGLMRGPLTISLEAYFKNAYPPYLSPDDFERCDILSLTAGKIPSGNFF